MNSPSQSPGVDFKKLSFEWQACDPVGIAVSALVRDNIGCLATIADYVPTLHPNETELTDRAFQIEGIVCEIFGGRDPELVLQRLRTTDTFQGCFRGQTLDELRDLASNFMGTGTGLDELRRALEIAHRNTA